jgi:hypothetical protein
VNRMDVALARLEAAVSRLERASAKHNADDSPEVTAELRQAREDYAALKQKTDGVANRLDAAIGRLSGLLDEVAE